MFVALVLLAGGTSARPNVKNPAITTAENSVVDQDTHTLDEKRSGDTAGHQIRKKRTSYAAPDCPNPIPNPNFRLEPRWYEQFLGSYHYGGPPYICP